MKHIQAITLTTLLFLLPGCAGGLFIGAAAVGTAAGSGAFDERTVARHTDDVTIATKIDARLLAEKDMPSRWVSVEVVHGRAILTGYLPSQAHIDRALLITRQVDGVVAVTNKLRIGEPTLGTIISDSLITSKVKMGLWNDKQVSGFGIHVETVNGRVYLQGIVDEPTLRRRAVAIARKIDGVTAVINLMRSSKE